MKKNIKKEVREEIRKLVTKVKDDKLQDFAEKEIRDIVCDKERIIAEASAIIYDTMMEIVGEVEMEDVF